MLSQVHKQHIVTKYLTTCSVSQLMFNEVELHKNVHNFWYAGFIAREVLSYKYTVKSEYHADLWEGKLIFMHIQVRSFKASDFPMVQSLPALTRSCLDFYKQLTIFKTISYLFWHTCGAQLRLCWHSKNNK